jgi:hypothetical protein
VTITCPVLTSGNYTVCAIKVEAILNVKGVWEAVSPTNGATVNEKKKNKTAKAQLLGALSEGILMQELGKKTAKELLESIKTRFVGADLVKATRLSTLRGEIDGLYMAEGKRLDDYVITLTKYTSLLGLQVQNVVAREFSPYG